MFSNNIDEIFAKIEKFHREYQEQALAEIIAKYDFYVGSEEVKTKLMEAFPEEANIIYTPYIESPTTVYAIKKFDPRDLFTSPYKPESEE